MIYKAQIKMQYIRKFFQYFFLVYLFCTVFPVVPVILKFLCKFS
nr:MAG TPA: hypothetical protein [Caudoviricetes sp.]